MTSADDSPAPAKRWVPMIEAERILGAPESTIRRWIRQGRITGEQVLRDPDNPRDTRMVWRVLVTDSPEPATLSESEQAPETSHEPSAPATGLLAIIEADRQTIASLHAQVISLTERVGRAETESAWMNNRALTLEEDLKRERDRLRAAETRATAEHERAEQLARELAARRWWRFWR